MEWTEIYEDSHSGKITDDTTVYVQYLSFVPCWQWVIMNNLKIVADCTVDNKFTSADMAKKHAEEFIKQTNMQFI